MLLLKTFEFFS